MTCLSIWRFCGDQELCLNPPDPIEFQFLSLNIDYIQMNKLQISDFRLDRSNHIRTIQNLRSTYYLCYLGPNKSPKLQEMKSDCKNIPQYHGEVCYSGKGVR